MNAGVRLALVCFVTFPAIATEQIVVSRVEKMPRLPQPLHVLDWKQTARAYYTVFFDPDAKGTGLPAVQLEADRKHFGVDAYLAPDRRRDPRGEAHACVLPVIGASLVGLDMTQLHGMNWVEPAGDWFDPRTHLWANRAGSARRFSHVIYDVWPLAIGTLLAARFPSNEVFDTALRQQADTLLQMGRALGFPGKLDLDRTCEFRDGTWTVTPRRIDSNVGNAATFAWALYAAYTRTNNAEYLVAAREAIAWWLAHPGRYEMSHAMGPLVLARLNAEHGCDLDMDRMLDIWFGDYSAFTPPLAEDQVMPWGIVAGSRPGGRACDGLDGACWRGTREGGFYAFAMGSYQAPAWLLPAVRYDQRIARTAARYALNAANSCRFFLGVDLDWDHQDHKDWRDALPAGAGYLFSYEGVRSEPHARTPEHNPQPYATGDAISLFKHRNGPRPPPEQYWIDKKEFSSRSDNIALYMGGSIGFLGALYNATDIEGIPAWDLNATDHFAPPSYPTRLFYNPHEAAKTVTLNVGAAPVDLYDTVAGGFLQRGVHDAVKLDLAADQVAVIVFVPAGAETKRAGRQLRANGITIDFRASAAERSPESAGTAIVPTSSGHEYCIARSP